MELGRPAESVAIAILAVFAARSASPQEAVNHATRVDVVSRNRAGCVVFNSYGSLAASCPRTRNVEGGDSPTSSAHGYIWREYLPQCGELTGHGISSAVNCQEPALLVLSAARKHQVA